MVQGDGDEVGVGGGDAGVGGAAGGEASVAVLRSAAAKSARQAMQKMGLNDDFYLAEPFMAIQVEVSAEAVGEVLNDLASRRNGEIKNVQSVGGQSGVLVAPFSLVDAEAPLSSLVGYSTALRSLTQGMGAFTMRPAAFRAVPPLRQLQLLKGLVG